MNKLTSVLFVDSIERCLPFWTETLSFQVTVEVPADDALGFVILRCGAVELMLQSRASLRADVPALADETFRSALFIEVDDLDPLLAALAQAEPVFPERTTFYGMREVGVRDPAGNIVTFAQPSARQ